MFSDRTDQALLYFAFKSAFGNGNKIRCLLRAHGAGELASRVLLPNFKQPKHAIHFGMQIGV